MFKTVFTVIALAAAITAAPLSISEPPDHPDSGGSTFNLDLGVNTITGSVSGCPNCGGDFKDNFTLYLPIGFTISSASLSATVDTGGAANPSGACFTSAGCFFTGFFSGLSTTAFDNPDRTFSFTATSPYSAPSVEIAGNSAYTLTYTVTASTRGGEVPEPGTWLLLAGGLTFVASRRYKTASGTAEVATPRLDVSFSKYK